MVHVRCTHCAAEDDVETVPVGYSCPSCGAVSGFHMSVLLEGTVTAHGALRTKGRDESGKTFLDAKSGADLFRLTGEWNDVTQIVDRRNDRYVKKIINSAGEVIRDEDRPLSEHEPTAVKRRRQAEQDGG